VLTNQTAETLQNLSLELATVGELRLCERPGLMVIAPGATRRLTVNLKVSSTESGVIYGTIVYDAASAAGGRRCINLADVHVDIMSLIHAHEVTDTRFRAMWSEFEWENKVAINTAITDVREYARHIIRETNMCCLNEEATFAGGTEFLSANLVARSIFGEDALINVSVEREADGKLVGTCRIRAKQQGLALSLGDRITLKQKGREAKGSEQQQQQQVPAAAAPPAPIAVE
jgi:coatomer subunit beta